MKLFFADFQSTMCKRQLRGNRSWVISVFTAIICSEKSVLKRRNNFL